MIEGEQLIGDGRPESDHWPRVVVLEHGADALPPESAGSRVEGERVLLFTGLIVPYPPITYHARPPELAPSPSQADLKRHPAQDDA